MVPLTLPNAICLASSKEIFGDYLSQPKKDGGLGLGTVGTSAIFLVIILSLVIYLTKTRETSFPLAQMTEECVDTNETRIKTKVESIAY